MQPLNVKDTVMRDLVICTAEFRELMWIQEPKIKPMEDILRAPGVSARGELHWRIEEIEHTSL